MICVIAKKQLDKPTECGYNIHNYEYTTGIGADVDPYRVQAELIKAMAHPVRLRILEILAHEECCVCHLTTVLGKRQAYVSQQLMILRDAKLVVDRREGVVVYYRLADRLVAEAIALTRQLLAATGRELGFPPVAESPVDGCPCPKCSSSLWSN